MAVVTAMANFTDVELTMLTDAVALQSSMVPELNVFFIL
jgi:hypothetical protein